MQSGNYANGQPKTELADGVLTHFFVDGRVKARGPVTADGEMDGDWVFYKKEGFLWQTGRFARGVQHGVWTVYAPDGAVQSEKVFERGRLVERR